ncbi:MAG: alpha/beta fold hydrolase [Deltaproteobacteria bacterium]|nr:alpha/beta fold hydrolase [Deltaproteobacteria bacterium]MBI3387050.1 alpha/beta fold hydrolase [Deltaproteobacteria bacterium]
MNLRIGELSVEVSGGESPKFTAPLLLLHGLWHTAAVWRRWSGFLAHRGWACYALNWRDCDGAAAASSLLEIEREIRRVIAALPAQPVVIGHDVGALLALRTATIARAAVALAPIVPRPFSDTPARLLRPALGFGRTIRAPRGARGRAYFGEPLDADTRESVVLLRTLVRDAIDIAPTATPTLVVAGSADAFVAQADVARLAQHVGAVLQMDPDAGHALHVERGWERRVGDVHRWIVQTLGDPLLALREESQETDDA